MPYITQKDRSNLLSVNQLKELGSVDHVGKLNYILSNIVLGFIESNGVSYTQMNNATGVLECVKAELYRRLASPYEDIKISENGDIYQDSLGVVHKVKSSVSGSA